MPKKVLISFEKSKVIFCFLAYIEQIKTHDSEFLKTEVDREDLLHVIHDSDIKKNRQNIEIEQEQIRIRVKGVNICLQGCKICLIVGLTPPQ